MRLWSPDTHRDEEHLYWLTQDCGHFNFQALTRKDAEAWHRHGHRVISVTTAERDTMNAIETLVSGLQQQFLVLSNEHYERLEREKGS